MQGNVGCRANGSLLVMNSLGAFRKCNSSANPSLAGNRQTVNHKVGCEEGKTT